MPTFSSTSQELPCSVNPTQGSSTVSHNITLLDALAYSQDALLANESQTAAPSAQLSFPNLDASANHANLRAVLDKAFAFIDSMSTDDW